MHCVNPLVVVAISELLEMIGRSSYALVPARSTALHSGITQTAGTGGVASIWENRCMHAQVCLLRAGQLKRAGDAAESGRFSCCENAPVTINGLMNFNENQNDIV